MDRMDVLRRRNWWTAAGVVILILIGLAGFFFIRPSSLVNRQNADSLSDTIENIQPVDSLPTASSDSQSVSMPAKPHQNFVKNRATPAGGFLNFRKYLNDSLQYPPEAKEAGIEGVVTLSFLVMPDSTIQKIRVARSLNATCDSEAVRLLKNGPDWIPAGSRKPSRQEVEIVFKLKNKEE